MQTGSDECAPPVAARMDDITHDNHDNIPTTVVDPTIRACGGKNTTRSVLQKEEFNENDLISYMRSYLKGNFRLSAIEQLLESLAKADPTLVGALIETELQGTSQGDLLNNIVDFDSNGDKVSEMWTTSAHRLWLALKSTNASNKNPKQRGSESCGVFGRVVQIHWLTSITTLQLIVTLGHHFDIERALSTFISRGPSICYHPDSTVGRGDRWFFCMKYYYLSSGEPESCPGQISGGFHEKKKGLNICRGSSSVALQFEDNGSEDHAPTMANPWRLLINSCEQQAPQPLPSLLSGVQAYLWGINQELTGVRRALRNISIQISAIAVPSDDFLFDRELRESVLFEDESYTNSRTYFWALQSLRIINDCIDSILTSWEISNTSRILRAEQDAVRLPHKPADDDTGKRKAIISSLMAIESQIQQLKNLIKENGAKQEEIIALRDGLFNASAVLEARTTVTQGNNIRILTYISMLFLPASFSTSIFGMQSILPASTKIYVFPIVMVAVCGPTYFLIWFLSWKRGKGWMDWMKKNARHCYNAETSEGVRREWLDIIRKKDQKEDWRR